MNKLFFLFVVISLNILAFATSDSPCRGAALVAGVAFSKNIAVEEVHDTRGYYATKVSDQLVMNTPTVVKTVEEYIITKDNNPIVKVEVQLTEKVSGPYFSQCLVGIVSRP